jgi:hypothetical protein
VLSASAVPRPQAPVRHPDGRLKRVCKYLHLAGRGVTCEYASTTTRNCK